VIVQRLRSISSAQALRVYVPAVVLAGGFVLADAALDAARTPRPIGWLALAGLAMVAGLFRLNFASESAKITIDEDTFIIAAALLFGPGPATLAIAASGFVSSFRRRMPARQIAFNTAALAVSMWAGSHAFFLASGIAPLAQSKPSLGGVVLPLLAMTAIYFALNSGLTAIAVGLDARQSPIQIWRRHFQWLSISYLAAASLAFCLILLIQQASMIAMVVVVPLLVVFHLTLRSSFGRVDDARRHLTDMDRLYLSTVETLAMAIDAKDDVTHSHVVRVQAYALGLARALGITDELELKAIEAAALLHDTGKLAVPEHILNKPGKLTDAEFEKMKRHVDVGADILSLVQFPYPVVPIVHCHHESWDGTGYPRGVAGEDIPIGARILSVVDCFDAITSDRPYRGRMTEEAALQILRERSGRMYDPHVVATFIEVYRSIPIAPGDIVAGHEVLQRIHQSRHEIDAPREPVADVPGAPSTDLLGFGSLARAAAGEACVTDVLALGSALLADLMPGSTGAWFLPDSAHDRLVVAAAFGPAAAALRATSVPVGERLTGWVGARRQPIVNSDAMLDLGARVNAVTPPLSRCMSLPLMVGDALVAVLTLYTAAPDGFTADHARLVQIAAPDLARAIDAAVRTQSASRGTVSPDRAAPRELSGPLGGPLRLVARCATVVPDTNAANHARDVPARRRRGSRIEGSGCLIR
jgi:putative nucleotidyltransferase with HDIG domain